MIDPAKQRHDDEADDEDRDAEQDDAPLLAIGAVDRAMMPTRLNRNEPMKVDRTFWVVESSMMRTFARGVTLLVAAE